MNQEPPHDPAPDGSPDRPGRAVVLIDLPCAQCGYDIKGLPVEGDCPECGLAVLPTIRPYVDPDSTAAPGLDHPVRTGWCLVAIAFLLLVVAVLLWLQDVALYAGSLPWLNVGHLTAFRSEMLLAGAIGCALALLATWCLEMPSKDRPDHHRVSRSLRGARLGMLALAMMFAITIIEERMRTVIPFGSGSVHPWTWNFIRIIMAVIAIFVAHRMRPMIEFLGRRSLRHRMGVASRQGVPALITAIAVVIVGDSLVLLQHALDQWGITLPGRHGLEVIAVWLTMIGTVMLTIGLMNLMLDAFRIQRGLARHLYKPEEIVGER